MVKRAWERAVASNWQYVPSLEEVARVEPTFERDIFRLDEEVQRQLVFVKASRETTDDG